MGSRKLVALAVAVLAVVTACGKEEPGTAAAAAPTPIASADEVLKVVDQGFAVYRPGTARTYPTRTVSYGFVIENVSDEVAVTVRVGVEFTDKAGDPMPDANGGGEFSVVLPGQRIGAGGTKTYDGEVVPADMAVTVTLIAGLDTVDGERHRTPPGLYAELTTGTPAERGTQGVRQAYDVEVTNTYDVPLRPRLTAVVRDAEGAIVGGASGSPVEQEIAPGATAPVTVARDVASPKLMKGKVECYAEPALGRIIVSNPVWQVMPEAR